MGAGVHARSLDVAELPAGVYVWRLETGEEAVTGTLAVVR